MKTKHFIPIIGILLTYLDDEKLPPQQAELFAVYHVAAATIVILSVLTAVFLSYNVVY